MLNEATVRQRMQALGIREEDLDERFILGTGPGGQKINKTASCVQLLHTPSGLEIKCQQDRSQARNRWIARNELCDQLEARRDAIRARRQQAREKARRRNRRRSPAQKARMLDDKKRHSRKKADRKRID